MVLDGAPPPVPAEPPAPEGSLPVPDVEPSHPVSVVMRTVRTLSFQSSGFDPICWILGCELCAAEGILIALSSLHINPYRNGLEQKIDDDLEQ